MSYHLMLLCVFIFLFHYCDHLFFLAGHVFPMVPGFGLEMGSGFSCHSSSSGLAGAYYAVFLRKEIFYGYICLLDCSHTANCYIQTHGISDICPIPGVACEGKYCEATTWVRHIDRLFYVLLC